jgi:hypothetical protein
MTDNSANTWGRRADRNGVPAALRSLRPCWGRWTAVVELFANRRPGRRRVDPQAYLEVHRGLTEACRTSVDRGEEPGPDFFRRLEGLVLPWLDTSVLAKADREILLDLLAPCRDVEKELRCRVESPATVRCLVLGLTALATLAASVSRDSFGNGASSGVLNHVAGWADCFRWVIDRAIGGGGLFTTGVAVISLVPCG